MLVLDARHMAGHGEEHQLVIHNDNDPTWYFRLRDQELNGTLTIVDKGDIYFVVRRIGQSLDEATSVAGEYVSDGIWKFDLVRSQFSGKTPFQVDQILGGRRKTFAHGSVAIE